MNGFNTPVDVARIRREIEARQREEALNISNKDCEGTANAD